MFHKSTTVLSVVYVYILFVFVVAVYHGKIILLVVSTKESGGLSFIFIHNKAVVDIKLRPLPSATPS